MAPEKPRCTSCPHTAARPVRLLSGALVCQACPRAAEERSARMRHLDRLQRMATLDERRDYLNRIEAQEGADVAADARVALALAWDEARKKDGQ